MSKYVKSKFIGYRCGKVHMEIDHITGKSTFYFDKVKNGICLSLKRNYFLNNFTRNGDAIYFYGTNIKRRIINIIYKTYFVDRYNMIKCHENP